MQTQGVAATGHSYIVYNREIQSWLTGSFCDFHQVSRYVSYRDSSIAIRIVSWGYRIVTPLLTMARPKDRLYSWSYTRLITCRPLPCSNGPPFVSKCLTLQFCDMSFVLFYCFMSALMLSRHLLVGLRFLHRDNLFRINGNVQCLFLELANWLDGE